MSDEDNPRLEFLDGSHEAFNIIKNSRKIKTRYLDVVSKEELVRILQVSKQVPEKVKLFIYATYLTSSRRNEVLAMKKGDFEFQKFQDDKTGKEHDIVVITMINQKSRQFTKKPAVLIKGIDLTEDYLIDQLLEYRKKIPSDNDKLFYFGKNVTSINKEVEKIKIETTYREPNWPIDWIVSLRFGLYPHYIRHCRLTHLGPLGANLADVAGWTKWDSELMNIYSRRDWQKIARLRIYNRF